MVRITKVLGFGETPPPVWEKLPKNPVFFSDRLPNHLVVNTNDQQCTSRMDDDNGMKHIKWKEALEMVNCFFKIDLLPD